MRTLKDKVVLITGGAGFIGSHLAEGVLKVGARKVVIVDNLFVGSLDNLAAIRDRIVFYKEDAADLHSMEMIIRTEGVQVIYNMATMALIYSFFNPHTAYMVNVKIADVLMHLLRNEEYETLIHASSSEVYGTARYVPMDENHPLNPTTPYAAGKAAADLLITSFCNVYNFDVVIIRPFNNYGPRQNMDGPLAGIIPATVRRIQSGEAPFVEGDGTQTRDYIYVSDTIRGLIAAYEQDNLRGEIINLGSGVEIQIVAIIKHICAYMGYTGEIVYKPERVADVKRLCASAEKAKGLLGLTCDIPFEEGIVKTLDWYLRDVCEK
ncbi:MAG: GDP-mannose 4,6-dehydratase [Oscillospiraceae bacterium]|nr:GDP-mannose 4,6-dehydratase [Oscillospiraceae bacterium]